MVKSRKIEKRKRKEKKRFLIYIYIEREGGSCVYQMNVLGFLLPLLREGDNICVYIYTLIGSDQTREKQFSLLGFTRTKLWKRI